MTEEEKVEYRSVVTELRVDMDKRKIFGLANVFGNQDAFGTVFDKGAFKKSIRQKFTGGKGKVKFLFNHDPFSILGTLTKLRENEEGLEFEGLVSDTPLGNDTLTLVQDGALTDNSIGFRRQKTELQGDDDDPVLHFTQVELFDVSPVTFGANDLAVIGGVREQLGLAAVDKIVEEVGRRFQISIPDLGLMTKDDLAEAMEELLGGNDDGESERTSKEAKDEGRGKEEKGTIDSHPKGADKSKTRDNKDNNERDGIARLRLQKQKVAVAGVEGR